MAWRAHALTRASFSPPALLWRPYLSALFSAFSPAPVPAERRRVAPRAGSLSPSPLLLPPWCQRRGVGRKNALAARKHIELGMGRARKPTFRAGMTWVSAFCAPPRLPCRRLLGATGNGEAAEAAASRAPRSANAAAAHRRGGRRLRAGTRLLRAFAFAEQRSPARSAARIKRAWRRGAFSHWTGTLRLVSLHLYPPSPVPMAALPASYLCGLSCTCCSR